MQVKIEIKEIKLFHNCLARNKSEHCLCHIKHVINVDYFNCARSRNCNSEKTKILVSASGKNFFLTRQRYRRANKPQMNYGVQIIARHCPPPTKKKPEKLKPASEIGFYPKDICHFQKR